jgi:hypothetical protein
MRKNLWPVDIVGGAVENAVDIIPNNEAVLTKPTTAIYVGIDGDLKVDLVGGTTVTFKSLVGGVFHPIRATKVYATGTTARDIVGVY